MDKASSDKVARAVETCVSYALDSDRPFRQVVDFMILLRNTPGWTKVELDETLGLILAELRVKRDGPRRVSPPSEG